ncbi:hypothetical protein D3C83_216130 [compost metagenome]
MCLIDFSSTETGMWFCDVFAPRPRGVTQRACHMPGIFTLCTYVYRPSTLSGMSTRGYLRPTIL